jgi:hypothetical protein
VFRTANDTSPDRIISYLPKKRGENLDDMKIVRTASKLTYVATTSSNLAAKLINPLQFSWQKDPGG